MEKEKLGNICSLICLDFFSRGKTIVDKDTFSSLVVKEFFNLHFHYQFIIDTCYFYYMPFLEDIKKQNKVKLIDIDLLEKDFDYDDIYIIREIFGDFPIDINIRKK